MKISDWLKNKGEYNQGLLLYMNYKKHNRNALRLLQIKQSSKNYDKLKYLLSKVPEKADNEVSFNIVSKPKTLNPVIEITKKEYRLLLLKDLPQELHELYIQQKSDFHNACSLKMQLNELTPEQEEEALELCIKIERLFDSIEKSWQIFDHYMEHKVVLKIEAQDFSKKTAVELLKAEKSKRQLIAKAKKRIDVLNKRLAETEDKPKKIKLKRQIESKNEARIKHEMELEQVIEFNSKK